MFIRPETPASLDCRITSNAERAPAFLCMWLLIPECTSDQGFFFTSEILERKETMSELKIEKKKVVVVASETEVKDGDWVSVHYTGTASKTEREV